MTPRQSAAQHLPQLTREWSALEDTFGRVTREHLVTPDGTWGADPTADWPRLPGLPWTPSRPTPRTRHAR